MNVNQSINKLLFALQQKGQLYKVNSFQFYSDKANKYCTKYQIMKKEIIEDITTLYVDGEKYNKEIEKSEKYNVDYECYNKIDILKYFMKEYKGMG